MLLFVYILPTSNIYLFIGIRFCFQQIQINTYSINLNAQCQLDKSILFPEDFYFLTQKITPCQSFVHLTSVFFGDCFNKSVDKLNFTYTQVLLGPD